MLFTFQLFQLTNYVKVLTFIFHLPLMLAHMEPMLCHWSEEGSHNGCPCLRYVCLFKRNFPDGITKRFTGKALQNIRQFWTVLTFRLLSPCDSKKLVFLQVARKHWREYNPTDPDQASWSNCFVSACHVLTASRQQPCIQPFPLCRETSMAN